MGGRRREWTTDVPELELGMAREVTRRHNHRLHVLDAAIGQGRDGRVPIYGGNRVGVKR
jgi:hypothetical protein